MSATRAWQISIDTGGTFTDCWALDPANRERRFKVLSSGALRSRVARVAAPNTIVLEDDWETPDDFFNGFRASTLPGNGFQGTVVSWSNTKRALTFAGGLPSSLAAGTLIELDAGEEAPVLGARLLTGTPLPEKFPPLKIRLATTRATNALLERKGDRVLFCITRGFRDLLQIRDQRRPDLFALGHRIPNPLYEEVIEIPERLDPDGNPLLPLDSSGEKQIRQQLRAAHARGLRTAAIALLHSYRNPAHELQLKEILEDIGFVHISLSSQLAPLIKILSRAETAVVDASLSTLMEDFFQRVETPLFPPEHNSTTSAQGGIHIMTSAGGFEPRRHCHAKDTLLSGPAGGVVGAAAVARGCGCEKFISFDMGGTSTDVARFDRDFHYRFETRVGDARLLAPALKIQTVAAGGGSICRFDESEGLTVGPQSAGSDPGPACYGKGGPLTLTDVNLLLDRMGEERVSIPFNRDAARDAFDALLRVMGVPDADETRRRAILEGLLEIAVERTADAIRTISLREGVDPREYTLVAFGGAGPLHACAVAEKLGIHTILVPADAGLLSAYGLHCAVLERFAEKQILRNLAGEIPDLETQLDRLASQAAARLHEEGVPVDDIMIRRRIAELRLQGQDSALPLDITEPEALAPAFNRRYQDIYGYPPPVNRPLELVTLRVVASTSPESIAGEKIPAPAGSPAADPEGETLAGPLTIQGEYSTLLIGRGWSGQKGSRGTVILKFSEVAPTRAGSGRNAPASVSSELFRHRFENIVEEMGARLQRSALSTNIKEREDFSCALLDARGRLVVNAPHIPVHLGALGLCVRTVIENTPLGPGDMIVTNHPAFGGSHLPDLTVLSAVFSPENPSIPVAYVANRAHHAEIGGITPGSMPPQADCLADEGVVLPPVFLLRAGKRDESAVARLLTTGSPHPSRAPEDNLADLGAQAAANLHGVRLLENLLHTHSADTVTGHLAELTNRSRHALRTLIESRDFAEAHAQEQLDDGTPIRLGVARTTHGLRFDFTGTAQSHSGNFNATPAIVQSALLYALRLFTQSGLPLNEGLLEDMEIVLPECFLNPVFSDDPEKCPAVVGGNVETSQRLVDTILKALRLEACSQGTMNNLIFGDDTFGYYETIAGGSGAGPRYHGASALHTHMTNTAITDPEILEQRYPVRLREFSIRTGSGGSGKYHGGDGVVRELEFLRPLTVSLLTQHREIAPYGMEGGAPGECGRQMLTASPASGTPQARPLPSSVTLEVSPGDVLRIETPGGGGWGEA